LQNTPSGVFCLGDVFSDEVHEFADVILLVFLHFFPECLAILAVARVTHIMIFYPPETFVLLGHLEHKIVDVIVKHRYDRVGRG